jgi:orotate phosphoribosyltransferase
MTSTVAITSARPSDWERLRQLVAERSFLRDGPYRLASGAMSDVFFDIKMTLLDPVGLDLVGSLVVDMLREEKIDAIGGLVLGACPIVDAVVLKRYSAGQPIAGFYVRKEPKARGTMKRIEGPLKPGSAVAIVEDVTTTGGSALTAVDAVLEQRCTVRKIVTVLDRQEGGAEAVKARGFDLCAIFTARDFK